MSISCGRDEQNPGGWSTPRPPTAEDQVRCDSVKPLVEAKINRIFCTFNAVLVIEQVVSGMNYIVKIDVGSEQFLHARIYEHFNGDLELIAVQFPKKNDDPLIPFEK